MSAFPDPRRVILLGATGSIGTQACDVIARYPDRLRLVGAVAGRDLRGLAGVVERFGVERSAVVDPPPGLALPAGCRAGADAACEVAAGSADVVCVGITGAAALPPTLAALEAGTDLAIANKEVLVMAGGLVRARAAATGASIFPVDSEHSAIWQCLRGETVESVRALILTASGGPFRDLPADRLQNVTPEQALRHPTWTMGPKVTVDSATLMNKGLETIEAHLLFGIPYERIDVAVHPTSMVHSYVEFCDGATIAQIGLPDMRVPIALALTGGVRLDGVCPSAELRSEPPLEFRYVDRARFPAVGVARLAGTRGGVAPAVLNAANEIAVEAFLAGRCRFGEIVPLVGAVVDAAPEVPDPSLDDLLAADRWARDEVLRATPGSSVWA